MFIRTTLLAVAASMTLGLAAGSAQAATKTFYHPKYKGDRLDLCMNWAQGCGKPVANAYCKMRGFKKSVGYTIDHNIGSSQPTRLIGTGAVCDQGFCDGFKRIKCYKPVIVQIPMKKTFYNPRWKGNRLDWCVNWSQGCGKAAANKYCAARGFKRAYSFQIAHNIGLSSPTRLIGTGAVCDQGFCDGFKKITCNKI